MRVDLVAVGLDDDRGADVDKASKWAVRGMLVATVPVLVVLGSRVASAAPTHTTIATS